MKPRLVDWGATKEFWHRVSSRWLHDYQEKAVTGTHGWARYAPALKKGN